MSAKIVSLGYERRSIDEVLNILASHKVVKLLDIRELPLSRRKGFSKNALSAHLEEAGIQYCHIRAAGNPHRKEKDDIKHCLRKYARYLQNNPAIIETIAAELSKKPVAVLCYEREHRNCHRSILLEALRQHGHPIQVIEAG
jgi:uncharacterized protein (DUF488 family)